MKKIAIIGECMIELSGQPFETLNQSFGGDTLNAAIYLARQTTSQETQVHYVTALGNDPLSDELLNRWQQENINIELVLRDPKRLPGMYMIQTDELGERTFMYWRSESAAKHLLNQPDFDSIAKQLVGMDLVFVSGITLAILSEPDRLKLLSLLNALRQKGVEIGFDSNFRPALWHSDQEVKQCYQAMYALTDIALVTFDDEQQIWGDVNGIETILRLFEAGVSRAVVKQGEYGCLVQDTTMPSEAIQIPANKVENVVDTTSAGDSFNGAFMAEYMRSGDLQLACQKGNALAAKVIQHKGAIICQQRLDQGN